MALRGRPPNPPKPGEVLRDILPLSEMFSDEELVIYNKLISFYLSDFDENDLSSSDVDDILDLVKNRILETRLLKASKDNPIAAADIGGAIEKLGKKNEKLKESLSARRKDRINPNEFKGFSIVDLAAAWTTERKRDLQEKSEKLKQREKEMLEKRKEYVGNRYDVDVKKKDKEDE